MRTGSTNELNGLMLVTAIPVGIFISSFYPSLCTLPIIKKSIDNDDKDNDNNDNDNTWDLRDGMKDGGGIQTIPKNVLIQIPTLSGQIQ